MKRKIIIGLTVFASFFVLGGIYLVVSIEITTHTLNNLIKLHQVELLREQLLIDAKKAQSDFAFERTRFARELDSVVVHVIRMDDEAEKCRGCHHSAAILERLADIKNHIQNYKDSLSRVLTMRANTDRLMVEEDRAFQIGQELVDKLRDMTSLTRKKLEERTQSSLREIAAMKNILFILIFAGPVLAIGLAGIFIKGFTKPLNALLQATRKVKSGDLSFRVQNLTDEFGEMATSFNEMAESLSEQMHKMQRAEQMTMVGQMAAGLVHEIKNPLAGIKGSMQLLLEEGSLPEDSRAILSRTMNEVQRIESLMKSLLNFAKPSQPLLAPVNMNDVLESTLSFSLPYSSLAARLPNAITIVRNFDPPLPLTMADPVQMQQVFLNLFMNAVDAMPDGGVLTVTTSGEGSGRGVRIEIADTGRGIDKEIRDKIFEPFFTTKHKGTGLGLAISKQFIEMHGGTISVEEHPAGGTVFRIVLPGSREEKAPKHIRIDGAC
ncbi:MAG: HAMP domain-containing protein [Deltaproteobacteria bacterium]|nr:HAMP domain-containing protein [Deltaproteobacteria bacterium]